MDRSINFDFQRIIPEQFGAYGNNPPNWMMDQSAAFAGGFMGGMIIFFVLILVVTLYVLMAWAMMRISQKTKTGRAWFAWVPILNIILWLNLGGFSGWYTLVFILPLVLIVVPFINLLVLFALMLFSVYIWMQICVRCKKPDYLGLFALVPLGSLALPLYLAISKK